MASCPSAPDVLGSRHVRSVRRRMTAAAGLLVAVSLIAVAAPAAGKLDVPDGLVSGRAHVLRLRPQIGELPREHAAISRRRHRSGSAAVASCDPARVAALQRVPTTVAGDDEPAACVVLLAGTAAKPHARAFLGPARITGNEILDVNRRRDPDGGYQVVLQLTERGRFLLAAATPETLPVRLRVDVDGEIVGSITVQPARGGAAGIEPRLVVLGTKLDAEAASALVRRIDQSRSEQLIELAERSTMTLRARKLMGRSAARVDDKPDFVIHCPDPESASTLTLGCYDGNIFVLRVDRADLAGVMTVTAAHEVLHAAFVEMSRAERERIVPELEAFMAETGDARIEELLVEYEAFQPGTRDNELHSLIGTQIRDLPPTLERYYRRFFTDRSAIVDAFHAYQKVFDDLQARYDQLAAEAAMLESQLAGVQSELDAASAEAGRLFDEIESLRSQGRIDESNALVDPQNGAVNRANALVSRFNGLVDEYNAKVSEVNDLAITLNDTLNAISPIPIELPQG